MAGKVTKNGVDELARFAVVIKEFCVVDGMVSCCWILEGKIVSFRRSQHLLSLPSVSSGPLYHHILYK